MATFYGTEANDTFYDDLGDDIYYTGGGDDTFYFTNIIDYEIVDNLIYVYNDYGFDTIYYEETGEVTINNIVSSPGNDGVNDYHTSLDSSRKDSSSDNITIINYHLSLNSIEYESNPIKPISYDDSLHYVLNENSENLILTGNELENQITGNTGNNLLFGDKGDDNLIGLQGNDIILGAAGNDTLTAHAGADTFVLSSPYDGSDSLTDFNQEEGDKIQISSTGFDIELDDYSKFSFDTNSNQVLFELTPSDLLSIMTLQPEASFNPISDINIIE